MTRTRRCLTLGALAVALASAPAMAVSQVAPPSARAPAASAACGFSVAAYDGVSFENAFAHAIDDDTLLRFIRTIETLPPAGQAMLLKTARRDPMDAEVAGAISRRCTGPEVSVRLARAAILLANAWQQDNVDEAMKGFVIGPLAGAIGALTERVDLPGPVVARALAPFTSATGFLVAASAPPPESSHCTLPDADASVVTSKEPEFPPLSEVKQTGAYVEVRVELRSSGYIEAVSVNKSESHADAQVRRECEEATILAAPQATYSPARRDLPIGTRNDAAQLELWVPLTPGERVTPEVGVGVRAGTTARLGSRAGRSAA